MQEVGCGRICPMFREETQSLLDRLCVELGFCLPPAEQERLCNAPPVEVDAFAEEVFRAEGLKPSRGSLYTQVRDMVNDAFENAAAARDTFLIANESNVSPDGLLRLKVIRDVDDTTLGFEGYPWHTHGDVIAGELELIGERGVSPEDAACRFIQDVVSGRMPIGVVRVDGQITDVWASYLPNTDDPYRPDLEHLELRRWDGKPWRDE